MALYTVLLLSISWSSVLHEGLGFPVIGQSEVNEPEPAHRVRTKRCSCNNQMDSECHYFCHLDIIWVNTPSKITVYGLGSPLARRRRSAGRCLCANSADQTCSSFCVHSLEEVRRVMLKNLSELLKDQSESPTADLHSALKKQHNVAPVVVVDGTVDRACIDVLTFVRRARTMKRIPAPRQRGSRVFRLAIAKFRLGTMRTAST